MLKSLVYLQHVNFEISKKLMKIIDEENLHIFRTTWGISMKFWEKNVSYEKVTKNQGFALSLENAVLEKPQSGESNWLPKPFKG